jgi:hypothetical protein
VIWRKIHIEDPNILGPTVKNLDAQTTWRMGFMGPFLQKNIFLKLTVSKKKGGGVQCSSYLLYKTFQRMKYEWKSVLYSSVEVWPHNCGPPLWVHVSPLLVITGNFLNYCSKFPSINFYLLSDETIEIANSMIDDEGNENRPSHITDKRSIANSFLQPFVIEFRQTSLFRKSYCVLYIHLHPYDPRRENQFWSAFLFYK